MHVYLLLGVVTGAILALTGAGGGILAVPLLILGARMSIAHAGPIGLLAGRRVAARVAGAQLQRGFALVAAMVAVGMLRKIVNAGV